MDVIHHENIGTLKDGEAFEWTIPGWILNHKYSTKRSDLFSHSRIPEFKFCLTLRPYTAANSISLNVQLHRIPVVKCGFNPDVRIPDSNLLPEIDIRFILYNENSVYKWSSSMNMQDDRITVLFPQVARYDFLNIQCIMMSRTSIPKINTLGAFSSSENSIDFPEEPHTLAHDMSALLKSGNLADVTLCVEDKEFSVHRCILASRSNVFAAMFNHDTQEKLENRIVIVDFSSDVIDQILKYIYTDEIDELTAEQYLSLFSAADKYAITDLRKKCSQQLRKNLPLNSVIHVLVTADLHQDDDLKEVALEMFLNNAVSVMSSEEWIPFMKNHTQLASTILMHLAKKSSGVQNT